MGLRLQLVVASPMVRTLETASGVFGGVSSAGSEHPRPTQIAACPCSALWAYTVAQA